ncbi:MAG: NERD domain-containing protein [Verrucomicrobia bacterium]|nr:NERD domain-containing protein [Verrucomicrobiota bacterium]
MGLGLRLLNFPAVKGWFGEKFVTILFRLHLPREQYRVYHNVTLPTEDGTTQIDHIIVCPYGIFSIETKNMRGWIFGSEHQASWTQSIYKKKIRFQNPLRQNYKHTETLRTLLDLPPNSVKSVVVFVGDSTFKTDMPPNVTYCRGCTDYILSFKEPVFDGDQLQHIHQSIQTGRLEPTRQTQRLHVKNLQARHETPAEPIVESADPVCPKCGAAMILRTARKGANAGNSFWGCGTYPVCKGTRNL